MRRVELSWAGLSLTINSIELFSTAVGVGRAPSRKHAAEDEARDVCCLAIG